MVGEHSGEIPRDILDAHYKTSQYVDVRFALNILTSRGPLDLVHAIHDGGRIEEGMTVIDAGTSSGAIPNQFAIEFLHKGPLVGFDRNPGQFTPTAQELHISELVDQEIAKHLTDPTIMDTQVSTWTRPVLEQADITNMPYADDLADRVICSMMMYHLTPVEQEMAFAEVKRVLKQDGVFVLTTSGDNNKYIHRQFEEIIARAFKDTTPPPHMNSGFTTEKAKVIMPQHFKHVYMLEQHDVMVIDTDAKVEMYINSLRTLRELFSPVPSEDDYEIELDTIKRTINEIRVRDGKFCDIISRSIFVATDDDSFVPLEGYKKVHP